jgi:hypothetical protein
MLEQAEYIVKLTSCHGLSKNVPIAGPELARGNTV